MPEKRFVLEGYLLTHTAVRRHLTNFVKQAEQLKNVTAENAGKLQKWFQLYWKIVEEHHLAEDNTAFPVLAQRDPVFAEKLEQLTADHHLIDELVVQINGRLEQVQKTTENDQPETAYQEFVQIAKRMQQEMFAHLDREEACFIPSVTEYLTPEEQMAAEEEIFKEMGFDHLALLFPWIFDTLQGEEYNHAYAGLPEPLKDMYDRAWRKQYAQITAAFAIN